MLGNSKETTKLFRFVIRKGKNMKNTNKVKLNPRKVFWKCGTCSQAMFHLLNHEFDNVKLQEEKASDILAGGIAQKGYQCGMLWGGALAVGVESIKRYNNHNQAIAAAIMTSQYLLESFIKRTKTVNCQEITGVDWESKFDFAIYMIKSIMRGFIFNPCFNLIVKWTPEAIQAANKGLSENINPNQSCVSCSTELLKKMGATEEESIMVAGFAGGIGLSGHTCGALGAALWYKGLELSKKNPDKSKSMFTNQDAKKFLRAFYMQTDSEMLCENICNKKFNTIDEHSKYIKSGGCNNLLEALATA